MSGVAVRSEVIEFGALPSAPWVARLDSISSLHAVRARLLEASAADDTGRRFVAPAAIAAALDVSPQQAAVLVELLAAVDARAVRGGGEPGGEPGGEQDAADPHALCLALAAHLFVRDAYKLPTADVWPAPPGDGGPPPQAEPSSPMRMTRRGGGGGARPGAPVARLAMQEHLACQAALAAGFAAFLARHARDVVALACDVPPPAAAGAGGGAGGSAGDLRRGLEGGITAAEAERLAFLLRPAARFEAGGGDDEPRPGAALPPPPGAAPQPAARHAEGGSPMDVCVPTPFSPDADDADFDNFDNGGAAAAAAGGGGGLTAGWALFANAARAAAAEDLAAWLAEQLRAGSGELAGSAAAAAAAAAGVAVGVSPAGVSPGASDAMQIGAGDAAAAGHAHHQAAVPMDASASAFNALMGSPPSGAPSPTYALGGGGGGGGGAPGDVVGLHRGTAIRGESDFPPCCPPPSAPGGAGPDRGGGTARVLDCHGAVVYLLAPLRYALVAGCSDCLVVLGAAGAALRVERCERVQVVAAARAACLAACHDCIAYLGVNRRPLLLGDNRFLQLAPFCGGYERLAAHMAAAGVAAAPNLWDRPLALLPGGAGVHAGHAHGQPGEAPPHADVGRRQAGGADAERGAGGGVPAAGGGAAEGGGAGGAEVVSSPVPGGPPTVTLLPPSKLVPIAPPFRGGAGPLAGGPAAGPRAAPPDSLGALLALGGAGGAAFPPSPFALPPAYAAAWDARVAGAAAVRADVKAAGLDDGRKAELMAAIQAHFKEWLSASGGMRQVYDLARAERDAAAAAAAAGGGEPPGERR